MNEQNAFDLGFEIGVVTGYDIGFEEGSWAGYQYAIDTIKRSGMKRDVLVVAGSILVAVSFTLLGVRLYRKFNKKQERLLYEKQA